MQFFERFFSLNMMDFGGSNLPIGMILTGVLLGMIVATVILQYSNAVVYRAIKALVRHKATDAASAQSLKALGLAADAHVMFALRHENSMLKRFIASVPGEAEETTDPKTEENISECPCKKKSNATGKEISNKKILTGRYYLCPENADRAKEILSTSSNTLWHTIAYCGAFLLLFLLLVWLLPTVLPLIL